MRRSDCDTLQIAKFARFDLKAVMGHSRGPSGSVLTAACALGLADLREISRLSCPVPLNGVDLDRETLRHFGPTILPTHPRFELAPDL